MIVFKSSIRLIPDFWSHNYSTYFKPLFCMLSLDINLLAKCEIKTKRSLRWKCILPYFSFNNLQIIFLLSLTLLWVPKSCAAIIKKTISKLLYYSLWKITITIQTYYQHPFWIHHWPYLHSSFYQTLVFAVWLSVKVENHQVKFLFAEVKQLKSIR